ncbi:MAG: helix-turn-helix domain-containing protein [Cellulosilyticaceae bacterium]
MMYYNLKKFGQTLKDIRHSQNITQKDICDKVLISQETLRKIENGLVIPKQETLDLLSVALNLDIAEIFLTCRIDSYHAFETLKHQIDLHLENSAFDQLEEDLPRLHHLSEENMNLYFKNQIMQLITMVQGILIEVKDKNYQRALSHYIQALAYTVTDFSLENYQTHHYSDLEVRLLMNVALVSVKLDDIAFATEILTFCITFCISHTSLHSSILLSKLYYNISNIYHILDDAQNALYYADLGITHTINNRSIVGLAHLYYRKGIAEYCLRVPTYNATLSYAKNLFLTSNQIDLHNKMVSSCYQYYGIKL